MKRIKNDPNLYFDYRDVKTMQRYIDVYGRIEPISKTGLSAKQQRREIYEKLPREDGASSSRRSGSRYRDRDPRGARLRRGTRLIRAHRR